MWLAEAPTNQAVILDTFGIESHQADNFSGLLANYQYLAAHAAQVIVLHPSARLLANRPRLSGLTNRMIDFESTQGFEEFCSTLRRVPGHPSLRSQIAELNKQSTVTLDRMRAALIGIGGTIEQLSKVFTPAELKSFRQGGRYTTDAARRFISLVDDAYQIILPRVPSQGRPKSRAEIPYSYAYRLTLCTFLAALTRIVDGNPASTSDAKLQNDFLDAYYTAAALFFDGLWTKDNRSRAVLGHATALMSLLWNTDCCRAHSWISGYEPRGRTSRSRP